MGTFDANATIYSSEHFGKLAVPLGLYRAGMPKKTAQARTAITRELLLEAARQIFVRDGYENAQLDEIAALAGRTKGSVYGHFESKEDLFLALLQERLKRQAEEMRERIRMSDDQKQNLATLRAFYRTLAEDRAWAILNLEFRLYALRHPDAKRRMRAVYKSVRPAKIEDRLKQAFGSESVVASRGVRTETVIAALEPILSALILESEVNIMPWPISQTAVVNLFDLVFAGYFEDRRR